MYHTTIPTDSLTVFRDSMKDTYKLGLETAEKRAIELGKRIREVCVSKGWKSVAQEGVEAPTVVVMYCNDAAVVGKFKENGVQVVGGVPFKVDEPAGLVTVRVGLFGVEKLQNVDRTVQLFEKALNKVV